MKKMVIVLLIITLVLSAVSVVFNLMIYNMKVDDVRTTKVSANAGNIGLTVEGNSQGGLDYGGS